MAYAGDQVSTRCRPPQATDPNDSSRWYTGTMRSVMRLLFLILLLSQGLAPLLPLEADACSEDGCTPTGCAQTCPACSCSMNRDRIAPQTIAILPAFQMLCRTFDPGDPIPPPSRAQDILHVPKASLA